MVNPLGPIKFKNIKDLPVKVTDWVGSNSSIVWHTILFMGIFSLGYFGVKVDTILLILTTAVSLEAIYLAIFIQMTVNRNTQSLEEVEEDIEGIQEEVKDLGEDVEEIQEDIGELNEEEAAELNTKLALDKIEAGMQKLITEIELLKQQRARQTEIHNSGAAKQAN